MAQETKNTATQEEKAQAAPMEPQSVGKKVVSDISGAGITASVLAAVTAFFFSSQIGLAGSVIGAAASALVTALSSSIYKSFIEGTKQKAIYQAQAASNATQAQTVAPPAPDEELKRAVYSSDQQAFEADNGKYSHAAAKAGGAGVSGSFNVMSKKWFAIILLTVIGLLTVLLTAHIINTATDGEGIGTKTTPIVQTTSSSSADAAATASSSSSSAKDAESSSSTEGASQSTSSSASSSSSSSATQSTSADGAKDADGSSSSSSSSTGSAAASQKASTSSASAGGQNGGAQTANDSADDEEA